VNLSNEIIALIVGLITTVLVPFLNKRFNNNPVIDSTANAVVTGLEKLEKTPAPPVAAPLAKGEYVVNPSALPKLESPAALTIPPAVAPETPPATPPNETGAL
jgi:hypothetical protein